MRLLIPITDLTQTLGLQKAAYNAGPRASHKYWRRVRAIVNGKLAWRYYYNTPEDRRRYADDQEAAKRRRAARAHAEHPDHPDGSPQHDQHADRGQFYSDNAHLRPTRTPLTDLHLHAVAERAGFKALEVSASSDVEKRAGNLLNDYASLGAGREPDDLHGQPLHPARATELAFNLLPDRIRGILDGPLREIRWTTSSEDPEFREKGRKRVVGLAYNTGKISIAFDRLAVGGGSAAGRAHAFNGGMQPVCVLLHEMAHQVQYEMQADPDRRLRPGMPTWNEWLTFHRDTLSKFVPASAREATITRYARTDEDEAFAESFAAALSYPHEMALKCPKTYDFIRKLVGEDSLRPRETDPARRKQLQEQLAATDDHVERRRLMRAIDMQEGLEDVAPNDPRMKWWEPKLDNPIGELLRESPREDWAAGSDNFINPPDPNAVGSHGRHDRFFEMSYGGRTIFLRVGPDGDQPYSGWDPNIPRNKGGGDLRVQEIKEVYDEHGNPLRVQDVYWHMHQDLLRDPATVIGQTKGADGKFVGVTVADVYGPDGGLTRGGSSTKALTERQALIRDVVGNVADPKLFFRSLNKESNFPGSEGDVELPKNMQTYEAWEKARKTDTSWTRPITREEWERHKEETLARILMRPHEISLTDFRQRSGTFTYDTVAMDGDHLLAELESLGAIEGRQLKDGRIVASKDASERQRELLEQLRALQPGVETYTGRDEKGRFQKAQVVLDRKGRPKLNRVKFTNQNPDGSETAIYAARDADGELRLEDPLWRALLTPNGEAIRSAAHLRDLLRRAGTERRRTWISIRTDRPRVRGKNGKLVVAEAGDTGRHFHLEVEFDGAGQPRILGDAWKARLGKEDPRLDDLLETDRVLTRFRSDARAIVPAEQVKLQPSTPRKPGSKPQDGDRLVFTAKPDELRGNFKSDKDVVVRVDRVIPGKAAGAVPEPPGWDRMPEGTPELRREIPMGTAAKKLRKEEVAWKAAGLLPEWYVGTKAQREWLDTYYTVAHGQWERTKDEETAKEYPTTYVLSGEVGGGAGRRTFRVAEESLIGRIRQPVESAVPQALTDDILAYMHEWVDPRTGKSLGQEMRLVLPDNGKWTPETLENMPGVEVRWVEEQEKDAGGTGLVDKNGKPVMVRRADAIVVNADQFHAFRRVLGDTLSLTDEANTLLERRIATLKEAAAATELTDAQLTLDQIDPGYLADNWGAALNKELPSGAAFELAQHQKELLQLLLRNNGRALAAHYMGTGKTVSSIVAAQMMMARRDPEDPTKPHPDAPKRVLIVAPLNTVEQWRQAASDFDGGARVIGSGSNDIPIESFTGNNPMTITDGEIVVVGPEYYTLHADKLKALGFDGMIVDEAHMGLKNEHAERNKKVRQWNPEMKMLMLLTGTPMTVSPADFLEYVKLLSNGEVWADHTAKSWANEYLEPTDVVQDLGTGRKGPKIQVKPGKRAEVAAILAQFTHIALPKDVKGKTLPATRIEENEHAYMDGIQGALYNFYMATAGADIDPSLLSPEEARKLEATVEIVDGVEKKITGSNEVKRAVYAAKMVANCPGIKPASDNQFIVYVTEVTGKDGKKKRAKVQFETWKPDWLFSKDRGAAAGKWPQVTELEPGMVAVYNQHFRHLFPEGYEAVAGKRIAETLGVKDAAAAKAKLAGDGWPKKVENPDWGPLGIRFRGTSKPWNVDLQERIDAAIRAGDNATAASLQAEMTKRRTEIDRALAFQRAVRVELEHNGEAYESQRAIAAVMAVADQWGITLEEGQQLLAVHPAAHAVQDSLTVRRGDEVITLTTADQWFSDKSGSLHLLYDKADWDHEKNAPKSKGGAESMRAGDYVKIPDKAAQAAGITKPEPPADFTPEEKADWDEQYADWTPPPLQYRGGDANDNGEMPLVRLDNGETVWIPKAQIRVQVASLMDPGKRASRAKADIAMTHGNAKSEALADHIRRFHMGGTEGERQMVLFANGILDGCRTMEATLRTMGFRDVNECIEGSPHYDATDPDTKDGTSPNGKYFVTYIGGTYTGDRELNVSIFQKVKDKLGRDGETSLFVHKCFAPRGQVSYKVGNDIVACNWPTYPGDVDPIDVRPSQWTPDQRKQIEVQFGIKPPESFVYLDAPGGGKQEAFFYGTPESAKILRDIVLLGDPTRIKDAAEAERVRKEIGKLKARYQQIAQANATTEPPMTDKQVSVFNNCEMIVCSDAAQVGMNLGNAVEMVMYDSLSSPMAEWQRITRSARMLPPSVSDILDHEKGHELPKSRFANAKKAARSGYSWSEAKDAWVATDDGPFTKLKKREAELFAPVAAREAPGGVVHGLSLGRALADGIGRSKMSSDTPTLTEALGFIRQAALSQANAYKAMSKEEAGVDLMKVVPEWEAIAAKAAAAANLGPAAAQSVLQEFKAMQAPGTTQQLLSFTAVQYDQPDEGTYDELEADEPEAKIRAALDGLSESDRQVIMDAGFRGTTDGQSGSHDPVAVYMAIRAQEILGWIESNRDRVASEMRSEAGGRIVTDADVNNRLIDSLSPTDRTILKSKKYLVNIKKIGAAGHVGRVVSHTWTDEEGKRHTDKLHTGYEEEYPVTTERQTRATGRARMVAFEEVLGDIQNRTSFRPKGDFAATSALNVARLSKGLPPVLVLSREVADA